MHIPIYVCKEWLIINYNFAPKPPLGGLGAEPPTGGLGAKLPAGSRGRASGGGPTKFLKICA